jgi:18S rRNA (adenine1779-N6/adenine1780-N6)-dimethyltransferase
MQRKLSIIRGDIVRTALPFFDVCVANVPYNVSRPWPCDGRAKLAREFAD